MARWIPLGDATIVRSNFLAHLEEPLFMNDVGVWAYRPDAATSIPNLYLAGDYCRSAIDLVSMEGAVSTGLLAAEAVRRDAEIAEPVEILVPDILPPAAVRTRYAGAVPACHSSQHLGSAHRSKGRHRSERHSTGRSETRD